MLPALSTTYAADQSEALMDIIERYCGNAPFCPYADDDYFHTSGWDHSNTQDTDWVDAKDFIAEEAAYIATNNAVSHFAKECIIVMTNADGEVVDVSTSYSWYNISSYALDTSGKQMIGEMTPEVAQEVLPYALMAEKANKNILSESEVAGYRILSKEELPEGLQSWVKDDESQRLEGSRSMVQFRNACTRLSKSKNRRHRSVIRRDRIIPTEWLPEGFGLVAHDLQPHELTLPGSRRNT